MINLKGFFFRSFFPLLHKENSSWRRSRFAWVQPQICLRHPPTSPFVYLCWQWETHRVMWLIWFILYHLFILLFFFFFICSESAAISRPGCRRDSCKKKIWEVLRFPSFAAQTTFRTATPSSPFFYSCAHKQSIGPLWVQRLHPPPPKKIRNKQKTNPTNIQAVRFTKQVLYIYNTNFGFVCVYPAVAALIKASREHTVSGLYLQNKENSVILSASAYV